jgi:tetratricopeptide (TPR) repeat protein
MKPRNNKSKSPLSNAKKAVNDKKQKDKSPLQKPNKGVNDMEQNDKLHPQKNNKAFKENYESKNFKEVYTIRNDKGLNGQDLAELLKNNNITTLNISRQDKGLNGVDLAELLKRNNNITSLNILETNISGKEGMETFCKYLHNIKYLSLSGSIAGDEGVKILAAELENNTSITELVLSNNTISDIGVKALCKALKNSTISKLDLSKNNIGDNCCEYLVDYIKNNKFIKEVNLDDNRITRIGGQILIDGFETNSSITKLELTKNHIGSDLESRLKSLLKEYATLYKQGLRFKELGEGKQAIEYFNKSINNKKDFDKAYYQKGLVLKMWYETGILESQNDLLGKALECFNKAMQFDPKNSLYKNAILSVLESQVKQYEEKIAEYEDTGNYKDGNYDKVIEIYQEQILIAECYDLSELYYKQGIALKKQGKHKVVLKKNNEAKEHYDNAIKSFNSSRHYSKAKKDFVNTEPNKEPFDLNNYLANICYNIGLVYKALGRLEEEKDDEIHKNKIYKEVSKEFYYKAIKRFDESINLDPKFDQAECANSKKKECLARIDQKNGNNDEAITQYDEAIKYRIEVIKFGLDEDLADLYYKKSEIYDVLGDEEKKKICRETHDKLKDKDLIKKIKKIIPETDKLMNERKYAEAIKIYDYAISISPDDCFINFHYKKALAEKALGNYENAIKCFDEAIRVDQQSHFIYEGAKLDILKDQAENYKKNGNYGDAVKKYEDAILIAPNNDLADLIYKKGLLFKKQGMIDNAIDCFSEAITKYDEAIEITKKADLYYKQGLVFRELGRLKENKNTNEAIEKYYDAIGCFDESIELDPQNSLYKNAKLGILKDQAENYKKNGNYDEAVAKYEAAISITPNNGELIYNKALVLKKQGKLDKAIECFGQAIECDPENSLYKNAKLDILKDQAQKAQKAGNYDEAVEKYAAAISIAPSNGELIYNKALVLKKQGKLKENEKKYNEAIEKYEDAIRCFDEHKDVDLNNSFIYNLAKLDILKDQAENYKKNSDFRNAVKIYKKAIKVASKDGIVSKEYLADLYYNKGLMRKKQGKLDKAIECFDESIQFDSQNSLYKNAKLGILKDQAKFLKDQAEKSDDYNIFIEQSYQAIKLYDEGIKIASKEDIAELSYMKGLVLKKQRVLDKALKCFNNAIEIDPENPSYKNAKLSILKDQAEKAKKNTNYDEAIGKYQEAIEIDSKDDLAYLYYKKGLVLKEQKKIDAAIGCFNRAISLDPNNAFIYNEANPIFQTDSERKILASLRNTNDYKVTIKYFDESIKEKVDSSLPFYTSNFNDDLTDLRLAESYYYYNQGVIYQKSGNPQNYPSAIQYFEKAIKIKPDFAEPYYNKGTILEILNDNRCAIESFKKAIEIKPDFAEAHIYKGIALSNLGEYEDALLSFDKAIELNKKLAQDYNNQGILLSNLSKYEKAIDFFHESIKIKPDFAETCYNRDNILEILKDYKEAIEFFDAAIKIKPDFAEEYHNKGITFSDLEKAIKFFKEAIELNDNFAEAYNNKGIALSNLSKYEDAIKSFEKAIELNDNFAEAYNNKGIALSNLRKYEDAITSFEKAIELNDNFAEAYNNKGIALSNSKLYEDAITSFDKAIELNKKFSEAYYNKGAILDYQNKQEEAISCFDEAIKNRSDFYEAIAKKKALEIIKDAKGNDDQQHNDEYIHSEFDKAFYNAQDYLNKGQKLRKEKKYEEAIESFKDSIKSKPLYHAYYFQARTYQDLGKNTLAVQSFNDAIEQNRSFKEAYYNKAVSLSYLEKHKDAATAFDEYVTRSIKDSKALMNLKKAYIGKGNALRYAVEKAKENGRPLTVEEEKAEYEKAIKCFTECLEKDKNFVLAYCSRAITYLALNEKTKAIEDFDEVSKIDSTNYSKQDMNENDVRYIEYIKQTLSEYKNTVKNLNDISNELQKDATEENKDKIKAVKKILEKETEQLIENKIKEIDKNKSSQETKEFSQDDIVKALASKVQAQEANNEFLMEMLMQLNERMEKLEGNKQIVSCITDIMYNNELLNHPELLTLAVQKFGISHALNLCGNLSRSLVADSIEYNSPELILAGCISLHDDDLI